MKRSSGAAFFISLVLIASMLMPVQAFAFADGKSHFKQGMKFEVTEEWDKAVEEFALAVTDSPKNPEYRLHLTRALFNASQMFIKKGTLAANEKDYAAAYTAFRRAYAFDPTNELAHAEMERMVRLQQDVVNTTPGAKSIGPDGGLIQTAYSPKKQDLPEPQSQRLEKLRDLPFETTGIDLMFIIRELAKELDLNVLFDTESFRTPGRKTYIGLKNVTPARALDYIFLQEGLFFQKVGPRTIMVATQAQRVKFQQLVLRTFYLANASPKDVAKVVQTAIPAQPGRSQTIVLTDDATNSITIRDTAENIQLIGALIASLDKDRAEVVMDVAIYEVNKSDLLQFGNQIGTAGNNGSLTNIGGVGFPIIRQGPTGPITGKIPFTVADALGVAVGLPVSSIAALQSKSDTKLIASTQIHAFNNEDSSARIGQRVPVQSAQFVTGADGRGTNGVVSNVINYEQVGLTLKFKPLVFPNQDVQVAMEIESKDVAGASTLTPTFTERTIKGTARIQNNKTLLLASVAQGSETKGRQGLPLIGLIPIIGRLFTAPTRDNRQVDIVIAVTPRVIRAPAILPSDEVERPTGSLAVPTNSSLEALVIDEDRQDMLAAARRTPTNTQVQLPDRPAESPQYVKTDPTGSTGTAVPSQNTAAAQTPEGVLRPMDNSVKTLQLTQTSDNGVAVTAPTEIRNDGPASPAGGVGLKFGLDLPDMKAGETLKVPVVLDGNGSFRSAVLGLKFDPAKVAVTGVTYGDLFGLSANSAVAPFLNQEGKMYVSLGSKDASDMSASGVIAYVEIRSLVIGRPTIDFDREVLSFVAADGKNLPIK